MGPYTKRMKIQTGSVYNTLAGLRQLSVVMIVMALSSGPLYAVELDVPYVETPEDIVQIMLDIAEVSPDDHVIDLGTGDGRIVIAAVQRGATGLGVDLDPLRIEEARQNAIKAGVADRVTFEVQDLFQTDISQATVVTLFLNSEVNIRLRPALFDQLKPGTRVVSHNFDMEDWQPDRQEELMLNSNKNFYIHDIFYWVIPADLNGQWQSSITDNQVQMNVSQQFQKIKVEVLIDGKALFIKKAELAGDGVVISAVDGDSGKQYLFSGQVYNDAIKGTVQINDGADMIHSDWSARHSAD